MKFNEIQQFTSNGHYAADVAWVQMLDALDRYVKMGLSMNPDFQRGHVWDESKQIAFVEFMLRGGKSAGNIYFNHPGWQSSYKGVFVLVDGKQRLEAARRFLLDEFPVFGHVRSEFQGRMPYSVGFKFCVNNLKTREQVLQWYLDLNTGGVVHTSDEIEKVQNLLAEEKDHNRP